MKLADIFNEKPERWGLRGDPYFWDYLKERAGDKDLITCDELVAWIKSEHLALSGEEMTPFSMVRIAEFEHGGMSSGGVSGEWWFEAGLPILKSRLRGDAGPIKVTFSRRSVCMGDDAGAGTYAVTMPDGATLGDLMRMALRGGNGNDWPIPYTGANSRWVIRSNIGDLGTICTDDAGIWHITYKLSEASPLDRLGIEWIFGDRF